MIDAQGKGRKHRYGRKSWTDEEAQGLGTERRDLPVLHKKRQVKGNSRFIPPRSLQSPCCSLGSATSLSDSRWSQQNRGEILAALLGGAEGSGREASLLTELRLRFSVLVWPLCSSSCTYSSMKSPDPPPPVMTTAPETSSHPVFISLGSFYVSLPN